MKRKEPEKLGNMAECRAAEYLESRGYRILARNFRTRFGEIDLVAEEIASNHVVVVEVKSASSENPPPEVHLNGRKQHKLSGLATLLAQKPEFRNRLIRFDLIAIVWPPGQSEPARLTHHVNAFQSSY